MENNQLEEYFPQLESIKVEVLEYEDFPREVKEEFSLYPRKRVFETLNPSNLLIECSNSICNKGGFQLLSVIREMVVNKETHKKGKEMCFGNESSPKGRDVYGICHHYFVYDISITYKSGQ